MIPLKNIPFLLSKIGYSRSCIKLNVSRQTSLTRMPKNPLIGAGFFVFVREKTPFRITERKREADSLLLLPIVFSSSNEATLAEKSR